MLLIAPALDIVGGQAVQASRLVEQFRAEPLVDVTFLPINPRLPPFVRRLKYIRTVVNFVVYIGLLIRRVTRSDVLHVFSAAHSSYFLWTVPAILCGRLFGRKVIVNYRDGRAGDHLTRSRLAVRTLRMADAIVTPSNYLVDTFARFGVPAVSIFNIADTTRFRFRERSRLRPRFMTNRGLEPLYNVSCLLRAFALIQHDYPEASLIVAHDGPCRPRLESLAAELGLQNTRFAGIVPPDQIPDLYDDADVYVMSPDIDNMPGSVLECFASGLPLISTEAGGVPYIVQDGVTGLLVPCGDHVALARAAIRLLRDPVLAGALSSRGRAECANYSGETIRRQWLHLYRELTSAKTHAAPLDSAA